MIDSYYSCDCEMDALRLDVNKNPDNNVPYVTYWSLFTYMGSQRSAWYLWWNKIKDFFAILFTGNTNRGQDVICLSKDRAKQLLKDLKKATGYKPKTQKKVGLFSTYFHDLGTFNALLVEPDTFEDAFVFWMCPECLLWEKHTRWSKAWRVLKNGCWTVASLCMDDEETRNLMDYLNTMLKLDWEGYKNEEAD